MFYYAEINREYEINGVYPIINKHCLFEESTNPNYILITEDLYNNGNELGDIVGQFYNTLSNEIEIVDPNWDMGQTCWMRYKDYQMKLSTKLDNMDKATSLKADIDHVHEGYANSNDLQVLEDAIDAKANANHTHTEYALVGHIHDNYATQVALDTLGLEVDGKADVSHTHLEYAPLAHSHDNYSPLVHSHTEYATQTSLDSAIETLEGEIDGKANASHTHSEYSATTHNHDTSYSPLSHSHTASEIGAATSGHNHDSVYAAITSLNELSSVVSSKANSSHNHDGVYDEYGASASALTSANAYTDSKIDTLVGEGASTTLDTIGEISAAITDNQDAIDLLNDAIANKANVADLNSHANNTAIHITSAERNQWNAKSNFSGNYNDLINKPSIPSIDGLASEDYVDNKVDAITAESIGALPNTTVIPTIPTNVSSFVNDAGYLTEHQSLNGLATESYVDAQIDAIDIPNALSDLTTDSTHRVVTDAEKATWNAKSDFSGSYNDLTNKPSIPSISGLATTTYVDEVASTKANSSHTHTIANVNGLQNTLNAKSDATHNHNTSYDTLGSANSALVSAKAYTDELIADEVTDRNSAIATAKSSAISTAASDATTKANNALASAKTYADNAVIAAKNDLLNGAGSAYDTLKELGDLIVDNADAIEALEAIASGKANASHTHTISNVTGLQSALDGKANTSHGTHVSYSTTAPVMDGTASVGSASTVSRSDHKHPTDTSRAAQTDLDALETVVAGKANASHTHTIANISNLQSTLDGKANSSHTHTVANISNLTATVTELNYMDGVTSNVQSQLDGKAASSHNHAASNITSGTLSSDRLPTVPISKGGTGATTAAGVLANLGVTATATELNYVDGVTSNIQTQLNGKSASGHTHNYASSSSAGGNANAAVKLATARKIGNASFDGTANISAQSICGFATCTGSSSTNANKYTKFARVTLEGAYSTCSGSLMFAPTEGNSVSGMLNYYLRNGSTITTTSINLYWQHLTNLNYEQSVIAVKISDGVFDLYYKTLNTWDTMKIININCNDPQRIALVSNTGWVDSVTAVSTSSINSNVSYAKSANTATTATTATKLGTNAGSATQPVYFSDGKPVATTYTLGKSVPSDAKFTDTVYTLPAAGSSLGGVKSGGDVTISSGTITVNDDSHNHIISNVDGLQAILDSKFPLNATKITETGTNLNDFEDAGIYVFAQAYTPTNIPAGTNGWLIVIPWEQGSGTVKQIWMRHGTVDSNDFELYTRTKVGSYEVWGAWSKFYTTSNPPTAAEVGATPAFTNDIGGVQYSYGSGSGKNVLTEISNMPQGLHTIYSIAGTTGNPETTESYRYLVHKTSGTIGWILAYGANGAVYSNYQSAAGSFKGWKVLYDPIRKPLWTGSYYMTAGHTATPSKKLSECQHGWMLMWSDYDPDTGDVNNTDFCTTMIPNRNWAGSTWNGASFYCDCPRYTAGTATDSESRVIKIVNVYDNKLVGNANNSAAPRNDVVLRAIYEF